MDCLVMDSGEHIMKHRNAMNCGTFLSMSSLRVHLLYVGSPVACWVEWLAEGG
jgi:hypothetical protein